MNNKSKNLISAGAAILLVTQLLTHFLAIPDIFRGFATGIGFALILIAFWVYRKGAKA